MFYEFNYIGEYLKVLLYDINVIFHIVSSYLLDVPYLQVSFIIVCWVGKDGWIADRSCLKQLNRNEYSLDLLSPRSKPVEYCSESNV